MVTFPMVTFPGAGTGTRSDETDDSGLGYEVLWFCSSVSGAQPLGFQQPARAVCRPELPGAHGGDRFGLLSFTAVQSPPTFLVPPGLQSALLGQDMLQVSAALPLHQPSRTLTLRVPRFCSPSSSSSHLPEGQVVAGSCSPSSRFALTAGNSLMVPGCSPNIPVHLSAAFSGCRMVFYMPGCSSLCCCSLA